MTLFGKMVCSDAIKLKIFERKTSWFRMVPKSSDVLIREGRGRFETLRHERGRPCEGRDG